jgi:hypothetical protein
MTIAHGDHGFSVVDADGLPLHRGLTQTGAQAIVDAFLDSDVEFGCTLRIVPSEPIPPTPPITFDLRPHWAIQPPKPNLPDVEAGEERAHLHGCIATRRERSDALAAAEAHAMQVRDHLAACELDVARLRAADEAETAAAGALLASRIKAGQAAPLEPNLRSGRNALLDAEARRDAAKKGLTLLDSDLSSAKQALAEADQAVQLGADVVLRAELHQRVEQLNALWAQITPLRQLIDDAVTTASPIDAALAREALKVPELKFLGDTFNRQRLHSYRLELRQDADATFADQTAEVKR